MLNVVQNGKPNVPELSKVAKQLDTLLGFAENIAKPAPEVEAAAAAKDLLRDLPKLVSWRYWVSITQKNV